MEHTIPMSERIGMLIDEVNASDRGPCSGRHTRKNPRLDCWACSLHERHMVLAYALSTARETAQGLEAER